MTGARRAPSRLSRRLAVGYGIAGVAALAWTPLAAVGAVAGTVTVVVALVRRSRSALGIALGLFVLAALGGAALGAPAETVVLTAVAGVLAWDSGVRAIALGEHLGSNAATARVELLHASASGCVGVGGAGVTYLGSGLPVAYPVASVLLLSAGVVVLVYARRSSE